MAERVSQYALTTLSRVKDRLSIVINDNDLLLTRLINAASTFIERECGKSGPEKYPNDGHFVQKIYTNEIYSISGSRQRVLILRNWPVQSIASLQYRAGTPSTPFWTDFTTDQYELVEEGTAGIVRVYGILPAMSANMVRATYTAGYLVSWDDAGDLSKHRLPDDLTNLCENLVVRIFKRRLLDGKSSEGINGAQTNWRDELDSFDKSVIANYKRFGTAF